MELPSSKELRQITADAIQREHEKKLKRLSDIQDANERKAKQDQLLAEQILSKVSEKCKLEAAEGRTHAVVMGLRNNRDYNHHRCSQHGDLTGPGALVWNALCQAGLDCAIEQWEDGAGINGGYNIIVKWY